MNTEKKYVIVGNSIAGLSVAQSICKNDPQVSIEEAVKLGKAQQDIMNELLR